MNSQAEDTPRDAVTNALRFLHLHNMTVRLFKIKLASLDSLHRANALQLLQIPYNMLHLRPIMLAYVRVCVCVCGVCVCVLARVAVIKHTAVRRQRRALLCVCQSYTSCAMCLYACSNVCVTLRACIMYLCTLLYSAV